MTSPITIITFYPLEYIIGLILFYHNLTNKIRSSYSKRISDSSNILFFLFVCSFDNSSVISSSSSIRNSYEKKKKTNNKNK